MRDLLYGSEHFNELERGLPGIPKTLLSQRLRRLQQVGLLERHVGPNGRGTRYQLTQAGRSLQAVVDAIIEWGAQWCFNEPRPEELDPVLLLWWMRDGVYAERLPERRVVVEFTFHEKPENSYWMVLERDDISHWPAGIFRRAFIRSYANALNLDPDTLVREFCDAHPAPADL